MDSGVGRCALVWCSGFYAGLGPILLKQVPYTMAKFAVQGKAAELMYKSAGKGPNELSGSANLGISLGSGVLAGVMAAIISQPADTLLSKINKAGAGGSGSTISRLGNIAREVGFKNLLLTGLPARYVRVARSLGPSPSPRSPSPRAAPRLAHSSAHSFLCCLLALI
jgi:hypothetical protein